MNYNMNDNSSLMVAYKMPYGDLSLAMAYVPMQATAYNVYTASEALKIGTLFPELNKPWVGMRGGY